MPKGGITTSPRGEVDSGTRTISPFKVEAVLEEAEKRIKLDEKRKRALQYLDQVIRYALAIGTALFSDQKIEQELFLRKNPLEWTLRVYWESEEEEELFDEKQRKLTDFL